jgi:hypothetical protein
MGNLPHTPGYIAGLSTLATSLCYREPSRGVSHQGLVGVGGCLYFTLLLQAAHAQPVAPQMLRSQGEGGMACTDGSLAQGQVPVQQHE